MRISNLLNNYSVSYAITSYNGRDAGSGTVGTRSFEDASLTAPNDGPYTVEITSDKSGSPRTASEVAESDEVTCRSKNGNLALKTLSAD